MRTLTKAVALTIMTFLVCTGANATGRGSSSDVESSAVAGAAAGAAAGATSGARVGVSVVGDEIVEGDQIYESEEIPAASAIPPEATSYGCDTSGGSTQVKGGGVGVSSPSYPCEVMRTKEAVDATERQGFVQGRLARFFLRGRLITKGIFSLVFGLVGLG